MSRALAAQRKACETLFPLRHREREDEDRTAIAIGQLGHPERKGEQLVAGGRPAREPVVALGQRQLGRRVHHEGGVKVWRSLSVRAAPQEQDLVLWGDVGCFDRTPMSDLAQRAPREETPATP